MQTTGSRPKLVVSADGRGVVSHAGSRLLTDLADATGLTATLTDALRRLRPRGTGHRAPGTGHRAPGTGHDPGRIAVDLAVILADGGQAICGLALLRDQPGVFGPVASTPTAWRMLAGIDQASPAGLRSARAAARETAWLQTAETVGGIPAARAGGRDLPGLTLDIDATLVTCHSDKEQAAPTYKQGFGYHPLLCFPDNTGEALAGLLRPGNAGANTATDHITVLDRALGTDPRRAPPRHPGPGPRRQRRQRENLPRPPAFPAGAGHPHILLGRIPGHRTRPPGDPGPARPVLAPRSRTRRHAAGRRRGRRTHRHGRPDRTPRQAQGSSSGASARTPAPSCRCSTSTKACAARRSSPTPPSAKDPCSILEVRHRGHATRRGPDPLRQEHRLRPLPLPPLRHQHRMAGAGTDRHRPARLDPDPPAGRRVGHRRAEETPLPPAARRRPPHPRRTTPPPANRRYLALAK